MRREGSQDKVQIAVAPINFLHIRRITSTVPGWTHQLTCKPLLPQLGDNSKPSTYVQDGCFPYIVPVSDILGRSPSPENLSKRRPQLCH